MTRFRDHAAAKQHIAGPEEIERMAAGIEDVRVDPASLEPQPGIVLTGDAGGDPLLASAHITAMSLDVDIGQALRAGTFGDDDHRGNERGADHATEPSMAETPERRRFQQRPGCKYRDYPIPR